MNTTGAAVTIRLIQQSDNTAMAAIIRTVFIEFDAPKTGTVFSDPTTDDLYSFFKNEKSIYFVAEADGELVGGCGIYPTPGLPEGCCELVKLYLLPHVRRIGLGKELIAKSIAAARQMGYTSMYLESMPEFGKAVSQYEKLGFTYLSAAMGNSTHFACSVWMMKDLS